MPSPLGRTPALELQRPGNFHSRAHIPWQLLGLGQTLEGDIIVMVGTCQVGKGRKRQVSRVSSECNKCSNDIGRIDESYRVGCVCDCCICRVRSPSEQVTLEMRPQVNLGEQCCKKKELSDARLEGP